MWRIQCNFDRKQDDSGGGSDFKDIRTIQACEGHVRQATARLEGTGYAFLGLKSRDLFFGGGIRGAVFRGLDWHSDDGEKCKR